MKVDNSSKPLGNTTTPTGAGRARASGGAQGGATTASTAAAGAPSSPSVETTLSGLQGLSSVLATSPVVDTERVAEIKRAIAEGRFQVNPEKIADGLLKSVRDMLTPEQP